MISIANDDRLCFRGFSVSSNNVRRTTETIGLTSRRDGEAKRIIIQVNWMYEGINLKIYSYAKYFVRTCPNHVNELSSRRTDEPGRQ